MHMVTSTAGPAGRHPSIVYRVVASNLHSLLFLEHGARNKCDTIVWSPEPSFWCTMRGGQVAVKLCDAPLSSNTAHGVLACHRWLLSGFSCWRNVFPSPHKVLYRLMN